VISLTVSLWYHVDWQVCPGCTPIHEFECFNKVRSFLGNHCLIVPSVNLDKKFCIKRLILGLFEWNLRLWPLFVFLNQHNYTLHVLEINFPSDRVLIHDEDNPARYQKYSFTQHIPLVHFKYVVRQENAKWFLSLILIYIYCVQHFVVAVYIQMVFQQFHFLQSPLFLNFIVCLVHLVAVLLQ